jgi:hypothetical protein
VKFVVTWVSNTEFEKKTWHRFHDDDDDDDDDNK